VVFGRELIKREEIYAIERGCTDAYLDTFSFQARAFYEKLAYRVFGTLEKSSGRTSASFHDKETEFRRSDQSEYLLGTPETIDGRRPLTLP
jgi:hypothetical protein